MKLPKFRKYWRICQNNWGFVRMFQESFNTIPGPRLGLSYYYPKTFCQILKHSLTWEFQEEAAHVVMWRLSTCDK